MEHANASFVRLYEGGSCFFFFLAYFCASGLKGLFAGAAGGSVWVGRRFCHWGSTLILAVFSSYVTIPCVHRNCENSVSLSVCTLIWLDRSVMLCHFPSLRVAKSFIIVKWFLCSISVLSHLKLAVHLVEV